MEVANASMYDGSTACAEAVLMAHRITKRKKAVLAGNLHPHYRETVETLSGMSDHAVVALRLAARRRGSARRSTARQLRRGANADVYGHLHDLRPIAEKAHAAGALLIAVVTEVVSLGLVTPPGEMGAISWSEKDSRSATRFVRRALCRLFASRRSIVRQMPGRLVGETVDAEGSAASCSRSRRASSTSGARRRPRTSAPIRALHARLHDPSRAARRGRLRGSRASITPMPELAEIARQVPGVEVLNETFFNEFTIRVPGDARGDREARRAGMLGGVPARASIPDARAARSRSSSHRPK
jgi:glycine dehydrogenase subunit 1